MSYKRVVKKNGKVYGPYVYESYRDEDGNVKKRYLGKKVEKKNFLSSNVLLVGIFAFLFLLGAGYTTDFYFNDGHFVAKLTGFVVEDGGDSGDSFRSSGDSSSADSSSEESSPSESPSEESSSGEEETVTDESPVEEVDADVGGGSSSGGSDVSGEEVFQESEDALDVLIELLEEGVDENMESGESSGGDSGFLDESEVVENVSESEDVLEIIENESEEEFLENVSENENSSELVENESEIVENISDVGEFFEDNISEIVVIGDLVGNESFLNESVENESEIIENFSEVPALQYKAVIGRPVRWIKKVNVSAGNLSVEIPKNSVNVSVLTGEEVGRALNEAEDFEDLIEEMDREEISSEGGILTGNVVFDLDSGKGILTRFWEWVFEVRISGNVILEEELEMNGVIFEEDDKVTVDLTDLVAGSEGAEVAVEYYTVAPEAFEVDLVKGKRVVVSADSSLNYSDVLAYALIDGEVLMDEDRLRIYWYEDSAEAEADRLAIGGEAESVDSLLRDGRNVLRKNVDFEKYDFDHDGFVDYVEWVVPHLSNQVYEIIYITNAEHLDSDRGFISDVYDEVSEFDGNYTYIGDGEYLRVTFERELDSSRDITIYARGVGGSSSVEVYVKDSDELVASFESVLGWDWHKIYLSDLDGSYDVFDLKVYGGVEFDYVVDPQGNVILSTTDLVADLTIMDSGYGFGGYFKWDISSIPEGVDLQSVKICSELMNYTADNDIYAYRFDVQSWTEASIEPEFDNVSDYDNLTASTISSTTIGQVTCFDVLNGISADYNESNTYSSVFILDPDNTFDATNIDTIFDDEGLAIGDYLVVYNIFCDREGSYSCSPTPFLNVTYNYSDSLDDVYYSVGTNTSDLMLGSPTLDVVSGLGLFSVAQADKVGVGDEVNYGSNLKGYISGRVNSTAYYLVDRLGVNLSDVSSATVNNITRAFNSLSAAESGASGANYLGSSNLTDLNVSLNIACYGDSVDATTVNVDGWTTGSENYIKIYTPVDSAEVGISQRHSGVWDDGAYTLNTSDGTQVLLINEQFVRVEGVQIDVPNGNYGIGAWDTGSLGGENHLSYTIIRGGLSSFEFGEGVGAQDVYIWNSVFYDYTDRPAINYGYGWVWNSVFYGAGSSGGFRNYAGNVEIKNTVAFNTSNDFAADGGGTNAITYCASDDGDGTNSISPSNWDNEFEDYLNKDFRLKAGSLLIDNGTSVSNFSDDIVGASRPQGSSWDIGAFEYVASVPQISFIDPTPANAETVYTDYVEVNVSVNTSALDEFVWNWNGTNYTLFNDSLVLMMNMDNVSALGEREGYVVDLSGNGNNGSDSGFDLDEIVSGKFGRAIDFDGTDDRIDFSDINLQTENSISYWLKYSDSGDAVIFGGGNGHYFSYIDDAAGDIYYSSGVGNFVNVAHAGLSGSTWAHIVVTRSGTDVNFYQDGVQLGTTQTLSGNDDLVISTIGSYYAGTFPLQGTLDEVRIWNRSLSAGEINQLYMSNLNKYDIDKWLFYINQTENASAGLADGDYTYRAFAGDGASWNSTEERSVTVGSAGSCAGASPPGSGDWVIDQATSCNNINITVNGDLIVEPGYVLDLTEVTLVVDGINVTGTIVIDDSPNTIWVNGMWDIYGVVNISNTTVRMNSTANDGLMNITVMPTGSLVINESSNITNGDTVGAYYNLITYTGSNFSMENSYLSKAGWAATGGFVVTGNVLSFSGNEVYDNYVGLYVYINDGHTFENSIFRENRGTGITIVSTDDTIFTNISSVDNVGDGLVLSSGSFDNTIINCNLSGNGDDGLAVNGERNVVNDSILNYNSGTGIEIYDANNNFSNLTIMSNGLYGVYIDSQDSNYMSGLLLDGNDVNVWIRAGSDSNVITRSRILNADTNGITFAGSTSDPSLNKIYDNLINNTVNFNTDNDFGNENYFNTTYSTSTNIMGGSVYGGNYWAYPNGTGYSETCEDSVAPIGICDVAYDLTEGTSVAVDYLPLAMVVPAPEIAFIDPTPADEATVYTNYVEVNVSVNTSALDEFIWNWNGTNYTLFNDSLVLMANFDNVSALGESDSLVVDVSESENNGSVSGGVNWESVGKFGGDFNFDGSDGTINFGSDASLSFDDNKNWTYSFWMKMGSLASSYPTLMTDSSGNNGCVIYWDSNYLYLWNGSAQALSAVNIYIDNWYHVAWTFNTVQSETVELYINGVLVDSSYGVYDFSDSAGDFVLGGTGIYALNGSIDEMRVYNRTLSEEEIGILYMSNLKKFDTDKWNFWVNQRGSASAGLAAGNYTYSAFAGDESDNWGSTEERIVEVDYNLPSIVLNSPENGSTINGSYALLNASVGGSMALEADLFAYYSDELDSDDSGLWDGLVGLWHFNNDSSVGENDTLFYDWSLNGNNGTNDGVSWSNSGKYGNSLDYNGSGGFVYVDHDTTLEFGAGSFTTSFWMKADSYAVGQNNDEAGLVGKLDASYYSGWVVRILESGYLSSYLDDGTNEGVVLSDDPIALDSWQFVTVVVDRDLDQLILYVNGVLNTDVDDISGYGSFDSQANEDLLIGARRYDQSFFNGSIDEVGVWNRSLSGREIFELYDKGRYKLLYTNESLSGGDDVLYSLTSMPLSVSEDMVLLMHMDNDSSFAENDTFVYDWSGNGNDGSVVSASFNSSGKFGGAYYFDGGDDYLSLASDVVDVDNITVCAWFNSNEINDNFHPLIGNGRFMFGLDSFNSRLFLSSDTSGGTDINSDTNSISIGEWFHACGVRESDGSGKIFINGIVNVTGDTNTPTSGFSLTVGAHGGSDYFFNGSIDDVAIWNRSLNDTEVAAIYELQGGRYYWTANVSDGSNSAQAEEWWFEVLDTSGYFKSYWNTSANESAGSSNQTQIVLPLYDGGTYDFTVNWGDGVIQTVTAWDSVNASHNYTSEGLYNVSISGTIVGFRFNNGGDKLKLLDISQWGSLNVGNSGGYFYGCSNFDSSASDALNLSGTTNLESMFRSAVSFNGDVSNWNTSGVTNMDSVFRSATSFNQDLDSWDVSGVTSMYSTFNSASNFNGSIGTWDVSSVTVSGSMFYDATSFNGNVSSWDVSSLTDMAYMFGGATSFDQDLGNWNVSLVDNANEMLENVKLSTENYDSLLIGWALLNLTNDTVFDGGLSQYCLANASRNVLNDSFNWTVSDGGMNCSEPVISSVEYYNESGVLGGNVTQGDNVTINVTLADNYGIDKVWIKVWDGVVGVSSILYEGFLTLVGAIWTVTFGTNSSFGPGDVNFTVFVNNSEGEEVNYNESFEVAGGAVEVAIINSVAYTNTTLECEINATGSVDVEWFIDDSLVKQNNSVSCSGTCYQYLGHNYTHNSESVICSVGGVNSSSITIQNYSTSLEAQNSTDSPGVDEQVVFYANYSSDETKFGLGLNRSEIGRDLWDTGDSGGQVYASEFYDCENSGFSDCLIVGGDYDMSVSLEVFYGNGSSNFDYDTGLTVGVISAGDLDGDGFEGEFSAGFYGASAPRWFNESGYVNGSSGGWIYSTGVGDVNGDGREDIVGSRNGYVYVYDYNGTQLWNYTTAQEILEVFVSDINLDGIGDVIFPLDTEQTVVLYGQNGSLMWETASGVYSRSAQSVDLDNDGNRSEVLVGRNNGLVSAYSRNGTQLWTIDVSSGNSYIVDIAVSDFDGDGFEDDFAFGTSSFIEEKIHFYSGNETGYELIFDHDVSGHNYYVKAIDLNDDGVSEVVAGGSSNFTYIIDVNNNSVFVHETLGPVGPYQSYGLGNTFGKGDVNRDGVNDLSVASFDGYVYVVQDVSCVVYFNDSNSYNMTWNDSLKKWQTNRSFGSAGVYEYNVSCSKGGYESQLVESGIEVGATSVYREVYYSVGTNASDLMEGSPTVDITDGYASFSVAQADKVGVGDEVNYGANLKVYISGRVSSTNYSVVTNLGAVPSDVSSATVNNITRAFNSLSAAESGAEGADYLGSSDLVSLNVSLNLACYGDGVDGSAVTVSGWTTGSENYIKIYTPVNSSEVGVSQRHSGVWGSGYRIETDVGAGNSFALYSNYTKIIGLQIKQFGSTSREHLQVLSGGCELSDLIIASNVTGGGSVGIEINHAEPLATYISNSIIYDLNSTGLRHASSGGYIFVSNVDILNCSTGIVGHWQNMFVLKNLLLYGNSDSYDEGGFASSEYVASDEGASFGTNYINISGNASSGLFVDYDNDDFRLVAGSALIDFGVDLSSDGNLSVVDDIAGVSRPQGSGFDIGAFELIPDYFKSYWNTSANESAGSSNQTQIVLPLYDGGTYDFTVNWGDGVIQTVTAWDSVNASHNYTSEGLYNVSISGTIVGFRFNNGGDKLKLLDISQWGSLNVGDNGGYFYGCANLVGTATDELNLSGTTDLNEMFYGASSFSGDVSSWNVSAATDMGYMFHTAESFNSDLSSWDVSNVDNMELMFRTASSFNGNVSNWDVSGVTNMYAMFYFAGNFSGDLSSWDVSNVGNIISMFESAVNFNSNISGWNVSSVTDMEGVFVGAILFNQDIGSWDVSNVTNMNSMFRYAYSFDQDLGEWNVSAVSNMANMFADVRLSTQNYDSLLIGWAALDLINDTVFDGGLSQYCLANASRNILNDSFNWTVTDGGYNCSEPVISSVDYYNESGVLEGNVTQGDNVTINVTLSDNYGIDKVWVKVWAGVVEASSVLYEGFLTLVGAIWTVTFGTNSTFGTGDVNFTVFVNNSEGEGVSYNSSFEVVLDRSTFFNSIGASPSPNGYGRNTTLSVNVTDPDGVDTVIVEVTDPDSQAVNYTMTNVSDIYSYNYLSWKNGTHSYRFYANDSLGSVGVSGSNTFDIFVNLTIQIRTLKDYYGANQMVNLTDPPERLVQEALDLMILNPKEYPVVGYNWTVLFDTEGTADLDVSAIEGTEYGVDLEQLEIRCDENLVESSFNGTHIHVDDWNCEGTGYHVVKVLTTGAHTQEFRFKGVVALAENTASIDICDSGDTTTTCTVSTSHTIDNNSALSYNNLVIASGGVLNTAAEEYFYISATSVLIESGGSITGNVNISASEVVVASGASINVGGKGYAGGYGLTAGSGPGGGSLTDRWSSGGGGGYGGVGGVGQSNSVAGSSYGLSTAPSYLGSGGGGAYNTDKYGGAGGGFVIISATDEIVINGSISANGAAGVANGGNGLLYGSGGGSGGSVWLTASVFAGSGSIAANGGAGGVDTYSGAQGGGGRIAVYYDSKTYSGTIAVSGANVGSQYIEKSGELTVQVNNVINITSDKNYGSVNITGGVLNILDGASVFANNLYISGGTINGNIDSDNVVVSGGATLNGNLSGVDVNILSGGSLTHDSNAGVSSGDADSGVMDYWLAISASNLNIASGGSISSNGKGYLGGYALTPGYGLGGGAVTDRWSSGGGGGYGGAGGLGQSNSVAGSTYGSQTEPWWLGSGGGGTNYTHTTGGLGGGAIRIIVSDVFVLNGTISSNGGNGVANGGNGLLYGSGGGSGGSVWVNTAVFAGTGSISANGGNGGSDTWTGGGGGGGRVAVYYDAKTFSGTISANGGTGLSSGSSGGASLTLYDPENLRYNNFKGVGRTTSLDHLTDASESVSNLCLEKASGRVCWKEDVSLNKSVNLDYAVSIRESGVVVDSLSYPVLNKSANVTVRGIPLGYPAIYKDGEECSSCQILSWDTDKGELAFSVSGFSNYTWQEANQSKIYNNGTDTNASVYLLMKVQKWNGTGWDSDEVVYNESVLHDLNFSDLVKFDQYFNGKWNSSVNGSGAGTYRVYSAAVDNESNVLTNFDGSDLVATYNFSVDLTGVSLVLDGPSNDSSFDSLPVYFNWTATDATSPVLSCDFYLDGIIHEFDISVDSGVQESYNLPTVEDGLHNWSVSCYDQGLNANVSETRWFTYVGNVAPNNVTPVLLAVDGLNLTSSDLNCSALVTDDDGDDLNVSVRWYKDGVLNLSIDYNNDYANGTVFSAILGSGNTTKGEVWNCSMRVSDGKGDPEYYLLETFDGSTEDNVWTYNSTYGSWDDDYTTDVLTGSQSLYGDSDSSIGSISINATFDEASGNVSARVGFKLNNTPGSTSSILHLSLKNSSGEDVCHGYLYWSSSGYFYRTYDYDGNHKAWSPTDDCNDKEYYFEIFYVPGTYCVYYVSNSTDVLFDSMRVDSSVGSEGVSRIKVWVVGNSEFILDDIEVRSDTNWGT